MIPMASSRRLIVSRVDAKRLEKHVLDVPVSEA